MQILKKEKTEVEKKRNLLSASTLIGDKVVNNKDEDLGKIQDIMIDIENGRVGYAVLSFGGILNIVGNKLFAIPWSSLRVDQDKKCFILNVEKEKLEKAPGFDKDNWPDMSDPQWGISVHTYYGEKPYWE